jgi:GT2 family glycosyltransferase
LVYSNGYYFDSTPSETNGSALDGLPSPSGDVFGSLLRGNFIMTPALTLIRRNLLEAEGGFDESPDLIAVEDYDLWLRLSLRAKVQFVPGYVASIRRHPNNLSTNILRHRQHILAVYKKLAQEQPTAIAANATACHEGQARDHSGIAILALRQHLWGLALRHSATALWHTLHLPGLGLGMMREWRYRSRQRSTTKQPSD